MAEAVVAGAAIGSIFSALLGRKKSEVSPSKNMSENQCRRFSMKELRKATDNFNKSNIIGAGGFGRVYKGIIDYESTQTVVAVKRTLDPESKQGNEGLETEIKMLSKCKHSNLVNLLGYRNKDQEMILVYEYMCGGNLADHLYFNKGSSLTWEQRLKICIGIARGLGYLHTGTGLSERIVHLDIKSDNILLDDNLAAKIADLGLSRIAPANQPNSQVNTVAIRGTAGYMDPVYAATFTFSSKSDVYSFGVVLLEVLTGTSVWGGKTIPKSDLADWIQQHISKKNLDSIVDPRIASEIRPESLNRFVYTARNMLQLESVKRPAMSSVIAQLECALEFQSSSPAAVEKDDPFEAGFEGQTSRLNYEPELLVNVPNVFGEPIGDKQTARMGFDPTRTNRAMAAYNTGNDDKYTKALGFLHNLRANSAFATKTLCMIYNATGETLNYVASRNFYGDSMPYSYPMHIYNGQWGAFMHTQTSMMPTGSVGAVVYRGKYTDNASCDRMITWSNIFGSNCSAYCEINESGHFDVADWDGVIKSRLNLAGPENKVTWNDCLTAVQIKREMTSTVFVAAFSLVGIHERCNQKNDGPSTQG